MTVYDLIKKIIEYCDDPNKGVAEYKIVIQHRDEKDQLWEMRLSDGGSSNGIIKE